MLASVFCLLSRSSSFVLPFVYQANLNVPNTKPWRAGRFRMDLHYCETETHQFNWLASSIEPFWPVFGASSGVRLRHTRQVVIASWVTELTSPAIIDASYILSDSFQTSSLALTIIIIIRIPIIILLAQLRDFCRVSLLTYCDFAPRGMKIICGLDDPKFQGSGQ